MQRQDDEIFQEKPAEEPQINKIFRVNLKYNDLVEYAKQVVQLYNGINAAQDLNVINGRHINLVAYYLVYGFSRETKERYSRVYGMKMDTLAALDSELVKRGFLVDYENSRKYRKLNPVLENLRYYFFLSKGNRQCLAIVFNRVEK